MRQEGAHSAERARAHLGERALDARRARPAPPSARGRGGVRGRARRRCSSACSRALPAARRRCSPAPSWTTRACSRAGQEALAELRALLGRPGPALDRQARRSDVLAGLEVHVGDNPQPDRVHVARPEAIRARRFEAVFVLRAPGGRVPAGRARPEPFLPDDDRREIATASGLRCRSARTSSTASATSSTSAPRAPSGCSCSARARATRRARPQARSFFLEDVRELLFDEPDACACARSATSPGPRRTRPPRPSGTARWPRAGRGARSAPGHARPRRRCSRYLAERGRSRRAALERFADCPVKWLVERVLRPEALEPDPEQMVRGQLAHEVLEHTFRRLREETGEPRVTRANLARGRADPARGAASERRSKFRISPKQTRVRAAVRRLEFDLLRHLRPEAERDGTFAPHSLELRFGEGEDDEHGPVELGDGLLVSGRIDRVDTSDGMALVLDYKSGRRRGHYKVASWEPENRFQAALYMLAVRELLGQARGGRRVRGARRRGPAAARDARRRRAASSGRAGSTTTACAPEEFEEKLDWARERIRETAAAIRARRARAARRTRARSAAAARTRRSAGASGERSPTSSARRSSGARARCSCGPARAAARPRCSWSASCARSWTTAWPVEGILAITFTEKAAAEMRERVRERFLELGRREDARAAEGASISTIHGFCARLLRTHALAAGIDPDYRVLDGLEAERLAVDAFDRALEDFLAGRPGDGRTPGPARPGRRPTRPTGCATWCAPPTRTCAAAASGARAARGRGARGRRASASGSRRRRARRWPSSAGPADRQRRGEGDRAASSAAWRSWSGSAGDQPAAPDAFEELELQGGNAKALATAACDEYREALAAYAALCVDPRARANHALLRVLLELYGDRYERLKRARSALDFEDLELLARDLLAATRACASSTRARFAHVMVDEFQDTNPLQNELLGLVARDNLFRVGDENQSIYGFRHADVSVFREHREAAAAEGRALERDGQLPLARRAARRGRRSPSSGSGATATSRCARRPSAREPAPDDAGVDLLVVDLAQGALGRPRCRRRRAPWAPAWPA